MPRRPRNLLDDGFFHVTARAVAGGALFVDETDRVDFVAQLRMTTGGFLCPGACID